MVVKKKHLAVMISGRGSNMETIIEACEADDFPAAVALVISDNADAKGIHTAQQAGLKAIAFSRKDYASKTDHENAISGAIDEAEIDLICLAGYMRILSSDFTQRYSGKLINIHPSLLPKYKGLDTHKRALEAGETEHGCTIHYVNDEMDGGEIIAQTKVPVLGDDTPDTLANRVLVEEHRLYREVIHQLCTD